MVQEKFLKDLVKQVAQRLSERQQMLVTAESCTGGLIGAYCTELAGSSEWFYGGVISYANEAKVDGLGVSDVTLNTEGAVSESTVQQMCAGALALGGDVAVAVSGVAGPSGGSVTKPVGCVYIGWQVKGQPAIVERCQFEGTRRAIRRETVARALQGVLEQTK
ncbi:Nicotinamide-nucleotide amidohydrolase PncC [Marinomonas aquimarina]|uniref:Nicotinamide-nucleotide amidohydrolase PncC n=1 Tax=Marinomonas aquimarina TaxID=295068 RepID=A0A1A8TNK3_9GAMM|nr:CinA family protein [Marinomonas aquimarina]SBS34233.1 Nicotinamide-nucleotide amidohydrolase PncC [Marinomonas aquimarina]